MVMKMISLQMLIKIVFIIFMQNIIWGVKYDLGFSLPIKQMKQITIYPKDLWVIHISSSIKNQLPNWTNTQITEGRFCCITAFIACIFIFNLHHQRVMCHAGWHDEGMLFTGAQCFQ